MIRKIIKFLIFISLIALLAFFGYEYYLKTHEPDDRLVIYGNVDIRLVDIGFRVLGQLETMTVDEGDVVETGQFLARLDQKPFIDEVREAEARVESFEAQLKNAIIVFNRRNELIGSGGVSEEDYEDANSKKENLTANLKEAIASLAQSNQRLLDTEAFAPTKGTILTRIREPGSIIKVGDPIFTISVASPIWIRAYVPEPKLGRVIPGMKAEIYTDTLGGKVYHGHVGFISPQAEFTPKNVETEDLRVDLVFRLRVLVDDADEGLRQGMPVTVKLIEENPLDSEIHIDKGNE